MDERIIVDNGANWVDIVGLTVGVVVAFAAFMAAYIAYTQTKQQIGQAAEQHTEQIALAGKHHLEQLTSILRPLVILRHLEGGLDNFGHTVQAHAEMWIENVGPGPATQVEFFGWIRVPKADLSDPVRRGEIEKLKEDIDLASPEFRIRVAAMGTNQCLGPMALVPEMEIPVVDYAEQSAVMIYIFTYCDVFENQRPSKPMAEWTLGHATFNRSGSLAKSLQ